MEHGEFCDGLLIIFSIKLNLAWNEPELRRKRTIEANWIELSGNTESISRHAALAVRHNYIRLKAQHAPDPATYVVVGCTRMYSAGHRRSANSNWSMEDSAIYNAFSRGHPSWHTCAWYTYIRTYGNVHTCMYTRTFISEWRPVRSSGVDATRRDSPIVAQNGRVADLN